MISQRQGQGIIDPEGKSHEKIAIVKNKFAC